MRFLDGDTKRSRVSNSGFHPLWDMQTEPAASDSNEFASPIDAGYALMKLAGKALFRRVAMTPIYVNTRNDFVVKDLVISPVRRSVTLKGEELKLSTKELDLLILFASNRGKVFSRSEILSQIWTNEFAGDDRSVDVLVKRLREKIESDTAHPFYILTKWGVGYYFTEQG
jgi:DNA-binding response OmpR family regulator